MLYPSVPPMLQGWHNIWPISWKASWWCWGRVSLASGQYFDGPHAHSALCPETNLLYTCIGPHPGHIHLFCPLVTTTGHLPYSHYSTGISLHWTTCTDLHWLHKAVIWNFTSSIPFSSPSLKNNKSLNQDLIQRFTKFFTHLLQKKPKTTHNCTHQKQASLKKST